MKQKVIRYKNLFTGEDVEKEYYFSLSRAEIAKMKLAHRGDIVEYFNEIVADKNGAELIEVYEGLLLKSVAVRDGDNLLKTPELVQQFTGSGAYEELFMELIQSEDAGLSFFAEVFPDGMMEEAQTKQEDDAKSKLSDEELLTMSDDEFMAVAGKNPMKWSKHMTALAMKRKTAA
jgi:hypothetical protein